MSDPDDGKGEAASDEAAGGRATPTAGGGEPRYRIELPTFEGPLDLLLHLIQKHELDVTDIPIGFITEKYVDYIMVMQELSIDVASEYLVMAATLAHIKSRMLLPAAPDDEEDPLEPELDPRAELVRRLLEYQKYKLVAGQLAERSVLGRDLFNRGSDAPKTDGPAPLAPVSMFKLLDALEAVLARVKQGEDHQIDFERISITDRINQLSDVLKLRTRLSFEDLFEGVRSRADIIVTFLALLEMTRLRLTRISQTAVYESITIELAVVDDEPTSESEPPAAAAPATESADATTESAPAEGEAPVARDVSQDDEP